MCDEPDEIENLTSKALTAAKRAFYNFLAEEDFDGAFWSVNFKAQNLTTDFKVLTEHSIIEKDRGEW